MKAISGRRTPMRTPPALGCSTAGPRSARELAGVDPPLQLLRSAPPEERGLAAVLRQARVEEDRQAELAPDPLAKGERGLSGRGLVDGPKRYERDNVCSPDPRMGTLVSAQVDSLRGARDSGEQRLDQLFAGPHEREHGPVVVPVGVDVEQPRRAREHLLEIGKDGGVPALREVRHRFER